MKDFCRIPIMARVSSFNPCRILKTTLTAKINTIVSSVNCKNYFSSNVIPAKKIAVKVNGLIYISEPLRIANIWRD